MWASYSNSKLELGARHVSFANRIPNIRSVVMAAGLWAIETISPSKQLYEALKNAYSDIVMSACNVQYKHDMSFKLWAGVFRSNIKTLIKKYGWDIYEMP